MEGPPHDRGGEPRRGQLRVVEGLAESEQSDWKYFGRLRHEREKKLRDPQDVLIEADRLRRRIKTRPTQRSELRNNSPPFAGCFDIANRGWYFGLST